MNVADGMASARALMDEHGLAHWKLELSRAHRTLGQTLLAGKTIRISRSHIQLNDWPTVKETVLHEIAHALADEKHGRYIKAHGPEWRRIAADVGCEQIASTARGHVTPEARYRGVCECGTPHSRHRMPPAGSRYTCKKCHGPVIWTDSKE